MVENLIPKSVLNISLILITLTVGIILHKTGRPYSTGVFALHKLTTVVFVVLMIRMIISLSNICQMNILLIVSTSIASISILGLIVSGGAMSLNKSHELMLNIHRVSTLVFLLCLSGFFYSLFQFKQS